jgi:hypothetical protein
MQTSLWMKFEAGNNHNRRWKKNQETITFCYSVLSSLRLLIYIMIYYENMHTTNNTCLFFSPFSSSSNASSSSSSQYSIPFLVIVPSKRRRHGHVEEGREFLRQHAMTSFKITFQNSSIPRDPRSFERSPPFASGGPRVVRS